MRCISGFELMPMALSHSSCYHEKNAAADLVAAAHRGESLSLIELGRAFIASQTEGRAYDWSIIIMREALERATEDAESVIDELADEIILEHLQPAHETVLAEAIELVSAIGAAQINELLNSPRLAIYDGRHERSCEECTAPACATG